MFATANCILLKNSVGFQLLTSSSSSPSAVRRQDPQKQLKRQKNSFTFLPISGFHLPQKWCQGAAWWKGLLYRNYFSLRNRLRTWYVLKTIKQPPRCDYITVGFQLIKHYLKNYSSYYQLMHMPSSTILWQHWSLRGYWFLKGKKNKQTRETPQKNLFLFFSNF